MNSITMNYNSWPNQINEHHLETQYPNPSLFFIYKHYTALIIQKSKGTHHRKHPQVINCSWYDKQCTATMLKKAICNLQNQVWFKKTLF